MVGTGVSISKKKDKGGMDEPAIAAIAMHADPGADAVLDRLVAARAADRRAQAGRVLDGQLPRPARVRDAASGSWPRTRAPRCASTWCSP